MPGNQKKYKGEETIRLAEQLALEGKTNAAIAKCCQITPAYLYTWFKTYPKLKETIEKARREKVKPLIEKATRKTATGYWVEETIEREEYSEREGLKTIKETKRRWIPPDPAQQRFLLRTADPETYRDNENNIAMNVNAKNVLVLPAGVSVEEWEEMQANKEKQAGKVIEGEDA